MGKLETMEISLMNVHYPPHVGPEFMTQTIDIIMTKGKGIIVFGGDFNLSLNPSVDSTSGTHKAEKIRSKKCWVVSVNTLLGCSCWVEGVVRGSFTAEQLVGLL